MEEGEAAIPYSAEKGGSGAAQPNSRYTDAGEHHQRRFSELRVAAVWLIQAQNKSNNLGNSSGN